LKNGGLRVCSILHGSSELGESGKSVESGDPGNEDTEMRTMSKKLNEEMKFKTTQALQTIKAI